MIVLVCGGRDFDDRQLVYDTLTYLDPKPSLIVHGGCHGPDMFAEEWAFPVVRTRVYYARWKQYGRAAGPLRNQHMLEDAKPDLVLAFPGGRGTADMVARAQAASVPVREIAARCASEN